MAYNLPPPWDAGYALPGNVRDEGLERRGFVTRWMPRGTYDAPKVGTGGYAVPKYVMDEGIGQGAMVTKWAPRGRYDIPVPHWLDQRSKVLAESRLPGGGTKVTFDALSGTELPKLYTDFGARAAKAVLTRVSQVPHGQRKAVLKSILDQIDPSLWKRVADIAAQIQKRSGATAAAALLPALAQAMSTGIAAEVVQAGLRRSAPQPRSLLGLGCYRARSALGADVAVAAPSIASQLLQFVAATSPQTCPPQPGFTWDPSSGGFWRRLAAGESPNPAPMVNGVCGGVATSSVPAPTGTVAPSSDRGTIVGSKIMQVGSFSIPLAARSATFTATSLPPAAYDDLMKQIAVASSKLSVMGGSYALKPAADYGLAYGADPLGTGTALQSAKAGGRFVVEQVILGNKPVYYFKHPENGNRYGVYAEWKGTAAAPAWRVSWKENEPDPITAGFSWLGNLPAKILDFASDVVDLVADLACKVASSPLAPAAGAAASVAAGAPPEAGAAGAVIAQRMCAGDAPPPGTIMPASASSNLLPLAIAGGVALVAIVLLKKKRT